MQYDYSYRTKALFCENYVYNFDVLRRNLVSAKVLFENIKL